MLGLFPRTPGGEVSNLSLERQFQPQTPEQAEDAKYVRWYCEVSMQAYAVGKPRKTQEAC